MKRQNLLLVLLMLLCGMRMQAQLLSVKTDALWDVAMTPNLGLEIVTGEKTSVNASVFGNSHPWGLKVKMLGVMPEFRYWFNGRPMTRTFVGVSAVGLSYDVTWGHENYDGDAYGLGLTFGYAFSLGLRWVLECHAGLGAVYYNHRQYYTYDRFTDRRNATGYALLPYKLGVTFAYIIK